MRTKDISLKPLNDILQKYGEEVQDAVFNSIESVATETVKELKDLSPKNTGRYSKGWTKTKTKKDWKRVEVTVYNKNKRYLTSLLNDGYLRKGGKVRVKGDMHIDMAEDFATDRLEEITMEVLSKL